MANWFWILKPADKVKWAQLYKDITGFDFVPPQDDKRGIHLEVKVEDTEKIEKIMQESPSYTVSKEGRE